MPSPRRFAVHGTYEPAVRGRLVTGGSFEEAALHFVEEHHLASVDEVSVIVEDCQTGERQCFRIDLQAGTTAPCS
jgi:hypothetical protein